MSTESAFDYWDRNQWQDVELDIEKVGGNTSPSFPSSHFICPLDIPVIQSGGGDNELNKCLRCTHKNCGGYNGVGPTPLNGATYSFVKKA